MGQIRTASFVGFVAYVWDRACELAGLGDSLSLIHSHRGAICRCLWPLTTSFGLPGTRTVCLEWSACTSTLIFYNSILAMQEFGTGRDRRLATDTLCLPVDFWGKFMGTARCFDSNRRMVLLNSSWCAGAIFRFYVKRLTMHTTLNLCSIVHFCTSKHNLCDNSPLSEREYF